MKGPIYPRYDGFYRSGLIHTEDWHAGVCMTKDEYESVKFFPDGFYISKSHRDREFNFSEFLAGLGIDAIRRRRYPDNDPVDGDGDSIYQTGHFTVEGTRLVLSTGMWMEFTTGPRWLEHRREMTMVSSDSMNGDRAVYEFRPG